MIDFVGRRYLYFFISLLIIVPGLIALGVHWVQFGVPFTMAIDFTGGTNWEMVDISGVPTTEQVRAIYEKYGIRDAVPQPETLEGKPGVLIRSSEVRPEVKPLIAAELKTLLGNFTEVRFESAGPAIGAEVSQRAAQAVGLAALAILLFLTIAFRKAPHPFRYGAAAIIAMFHDILVVLGLAAIFALFFGWQVDALFLTALLTVIGFSVHDTIVVFDRIRENLTRLRGMPFDNVVNHSIMQTLDRSLNTQLVVLFTLAALALFGGVTIRQFVLTMLIGILSGTYSSIFNAAQILVVWEDGDVGNFFRRLFGKTEKAPVS
ncbi:protein translocase subunit SecF [Anaerolineae bacterium CFX7]|nr:protein translocase subunit SecF [Anaerolineae bacterium CFX7]